MQDNTQEGSVDMQPAIVLNEAQFLEFIHEEINPDRVVPIISASISCVILGSSFCGWGS